MTTTVFVSLTCVAWLTFALEATLGVLALGVGATDMIGTLVDVHAGHLWVPVESWRTLAEVGAWRVDALGARATGLSGGRLALVDVEAGNQGAVGRLDGRLAARLDGPEQVGGRAGVSLEARRTGAPIAARYVGALGARSARIVPALVHVCNEVRLSCHCYY